ncbi:MAG TPA: hypothetical protein VK585_17095 [Jiangellaceae bacterium]|nr:hypothetical protein [Jiangellaceae bacterium]
MPTLTAVPSPPAPGSYALTLNHGGNERSYLLHVPEGYDTSAQPPLVLAFHGRPSTPREMELLSGLSEKADQEGFVGALIDEITNAWGADPERVYATGMSNGAQMVYRLAAEMGGRLAAIAPVSGAPVNPSQIGPATPVSLITFTGTADGVAIPAAEGLDTWRQRAGCPDPSLRTQDDGNGTAEIATSACDDGTEVVWYSITDMGHFWPGGERGVAADPTAPVNATEVIWDFFDQHPSAGTS